LGTIQYVYDVKRGIIFDILSLSISAIITIIGVFVAVKSFRQVLMKFETGWNQIPHEEDEVTINL
jgi:hypothetical protein